MTLLTGKGRSCNLGCSKQNILIEEAGKRVNNPEEFQGGRQVIRNGLSASRM
jgi:hypothetical protein